MAAAAKNIVVCLDGTGNQIEENLSNVLKLYRALETSSGQVVFYDQGVGTLGQRYTWGVLTQKVKSWLGLAFGLGLDDNVRQAYEFIARHYEERTVRGEVVRDRIFIFGFSRGAHTARVLAGMLYEIGLLRPNQLHLSGAALTAYKQTDAAALGDDAPDTADTYEGDAANFRRVAGTRTASIEFMGLWDTVSSVFIPNYRGFFPPITRERLPHTLKNPAVRNFRHAMAIDEFRRMFRVDRWKPGQVFKPNIYSQGEAAPQDAKEMWFAGCHSDVGGGYRRADSALSQYPLIWMLEEVEALTGLKVSSRMAKYVTGVKRWSSKTHYVYPKPDAAGSLHTSLTPLWWVGEALPKNDKFKEWPRRKSFLGYYIPFAEPRFIGPDDHIHPSVRQRMKKVPEYKPVNVPG